MNKKEIIDALIACDCTRFSEADRPWLEQQDEARLNTLRAPDNVAVKPVAPAPAPIAAAQADPPKPAEPARPQTLEEFLKGAPAEIAPILNEAVEERKAFKEKLIEAITANKSNTFSKEELEALDLKALKKIAALAQVEVPEPDYSGQAGNARGDQHDLGEFSVPDMPSTAPAPPK